MVKEITKKQPSATASRGGAFASSNIRSGNSAALPDTPTSSNSNIVSSDYTTPSKKYSASSQSLLRFDDVTTPATVASSSPPGSVESFSLSDSPVAASASATTKAASRKTANADGTFWRPRRVDKQELLSQQVRLCQQHDSLMTDRDELEVEHAGQVSRPNSNHHLDESSSNFDDDDDDAIGGVIAVGIAVPDKDNNNKNRTSENAPAAVADASVQLARNLAQEEHRIKTMAAAENSVAVRRTMAAPGSAVVAGRFKTNEPSTAGWNDAPQLTEGPSLAAGSFQSKSGQDDSMLSAKQREKMERQRASAAMARPSHNVASSDQKVPLAAIRSGVSRTMPDTPMSDDANAKARARDSARAVGVARSMGNGGGPTMAAAAAVSRAQKEIQKTEQMNEGPTLAPATSEAFGAQKLPSLQSAPSMTVPGAFASTQAPAREEIKQHHGDDSHAGPSLAPAEFSSVPPAAVTQAPFIVMQSTPTEEVHVGAYAIEGMDAHSDPYGSDDEFSITDQNRPYVPDMEEGFDDVFYVDPDDADAMERALEAELQVIVDGNVLTEEDEEPLDSKIVTRIRWYQRGVVCMSCCAIALVVGAILGFAQSNTPPSLGWIQAGSTLYGSQKEPQIFFGQSLDMTRDGKRIVIAAPGFDDELTHNKIGQVRIYDETVDLNGTKWEKSGTITGNEASAAVQMSVSASSDGHTIAIGKAQVQGGVVEVFTDKNGAWSMAQNFSIAAAGEEATWFGYAVALSHEASVLVASAPLADTPSGTKSGLVRAYQRSPSGWLQLGEDMTGLMGNELLGWSVSVQTAGASIRVVAGAPSSDNEKGLVRIFDWTGSNWKQAGKDLKGSSNLDRFGESVALSDDARVLAIGASGTAFVPGYVKVYRMASDDWMEDSHEFIGQEPADSFGMAVSLSSDGSVLAVGSGHASADAGRVEVFKYDAGQGDWSNEGLPLEGSPGDGFGSAVVLSGDGLRVLGGAPPAMFDGSLAQVGAIRVYDRDDDSSED